MKAIWNDQIIAESKETILMENNHYFPIDSIRQEFFVESDTQTNCWWKGDASYKSIKVGENVNKDAAWFYPDPKKEARQIKGYIAFWKGVKVEK